MLAPTAGRAAVANGLGGVPRVGLAKGVKVVVGELKAGLGVAESNSA